MHAADAADAARRNREWTLIFIGPQSRRIYEEKLRGYNFPDLSHRIISDSEILSSSWPFPSDLDKRDRPNALGRVTFPRLGEGQ